MAGDKARKAVDPVVRADYLKLEKNWLRLAEMADIQAETPPPFDIG
jgi:hypothetical protein